MMRMSINHLWMGFLAGTKHGSSGPEGNGLLAGTYRSRFVYLLEAAE